jgi:hypothetical protein
MIMKTGNFNHKLLFLVLACFPYMGIGQEKSINPDVKIDVRKEYDDNGNVIRYDSSYVYSWSSPSDGFSSWGSIPDSLFSKFGGFDRMPFDNDSLFSRFFEDWRIFPDNPTGSPHADFFHGFEDFFNQFGGFNDPFPQFFPFDSIDSNFGDLLEQHQRMMEEFWNGFGGGPQIIIPAPIDSLGIDKQRLENQTTPEPPRSYQPKNPSKTIVI